MENKKRPAVFFGMLFLAVLIVSTAVSGITYAYLSVDPGTAINVITVGDIKIDLKEEAWEKENAQELHPKETAAKDPVVVNTGSNPAYVFLEVVVPMRDFSAVSDDGKKEESKMQRLFQYDADLTSWELIEETVKGGKTVCVYGYRKVLLPGASTAPLFTEVSAVNYLEGSLEASDVCSIDITAKAIQDQMQTSVQSLKEIYAVFLRQTEMDSSSETTGSEWIQEDRNSETENDKGGDNY